MAYRRDDGTDGSYEAYDEGYQAYDTVEDHEAEDHLFRSRQTGMSHEPDRHYTKRDPSRRRERELAMAQRRAALSAERQSRTSNGRVHTGNVWGKADSKMSAGSGISHAAGTLWQSLWSSVNGSQRQRAAAQRQRLITSVIALCLCLTGLITFALVSVYRSKSVFSDSPLDDSAIQQRLITEEANRDRVTYFLIVGVDKSSKLTDCIWLMCFDNEAHQMNVMQIPRDTYVGRDSLPPHKINAVYSNPQTVDWCDKCKRAVAQDETEKGRHTVCGKKVTQKTESNISALIRCINSRLSLPVDHYVLFDFEGFEQIVDAMGGLDIYLEQETKVYPNKTDYEILPAGDNHLDGRMTLNFMRNRQIFLDGDLGRVRAQRRIVRAMMEKVSAMSPLQLFGLLRAGYGEFSTDMSLEEICSFIAPVKGCSPESLNMFTMPGTDHWIKPNPSYYLCDEAETAAKINEYLMPYSEKLTADDIRFPVLTD